MSDRTEHFNLSTILPGGSVNEDGNKYTLIDRELIDSLLYKGAISHKHDAATGDLADPTTAPGLTLSGTSGSLEPGVEYFYAYTYVDGEGFETVISSSDSITTGDRVATPTSPTASQTSTGGTLTAGTYSYRVSVYTVTSSTETLASSPVTVNVLGGTTNKITVTLPTLPTGADGWNVYRRAPGESGFVLVSTFASGPTTLVDDGSLTETTTRVPPNANTTNGTSSVTVAHSGSLPTNAVAWRIYRSTVSGSWRSSFLTEQTSTTYLDTGTATSTLSPPETSEVYGSPSKIDLADAAEVKNRLPMGSVAAFPFTIQFAFPGSQTVLTGTIPWVCEYPAAVIVGCRASLGYGYYPSSTDVIVDVDIAQSTATPTRVTIYTTQANRPRVLVGQQIGQRTVPDIIDLTEGDVLYCNVDQVGSGATPMDQDLVVNIYGVAIYQTASSTTYDV